MTGQDEERRVNARTKIGATLLLGVLLTSVASAEPPTSVQIEVNYLLGYMEGSGCEFYRNGTWYDSQRAQSHLRDKYKALVARNLVNTTEQFIERAATESSLSGEPYQVRCNGNAPVTTNRWMREKLAHFRTF